MTLVKRNDGLLGDFPTLWDDFFSRDLFNRPASTGTLSVPAVNVKETADTLEVEVAAPGMNKEDFNVEVDNDILSISSEKEHKAEERDEDGKYSRKEFSYTSFRRSFRLPDSVDSEKIKASYKDGVLKLSIPKKEEAKEKPARTIKIS